MLSKREKERILIEEILKIKKRTKRNLDECYIPMVWKPKKESEDLSGVWLGVGEDGLTYETMTEEELSMLPPFDWDSFYRECEQANFGVSNLELSICPDCLIDLDERNEKSFKKNGKKKKVVRKDLSPILPKNSSKTPDQLLFEKINIPTDLDERIEKYLSTKK